MNKSLMPNVEGAEYTQTCFLMQLLCALSIPAFKLGDPFEPSIPTSQLRTLGSSFLCSHQYKYSTEVQEFLKCSYQMACPHIDPNKLH